MCVNCWLGDLQSTLDNIKEAYTDSDQSWAIDPLSAAPVLEKAHTTIQEIMNLNQQLTEKNVTKSTDNKHPNMVQ